jgi:hypothetical protein
MTGLSNHGTLLAGPPAADPFAPTIMQPARSRNCMIGYLTELDVLGLLLKRHSRNRLSRRAGLRSGRAAAPSPEVESNSALV